MTWNKNSMESIDEIFQSAIKFRDSNKLAEAIEELQKIIISYPGHPKIAGVYTVLAGIYKGLNDYENSEKFFRIATEINPNSELASLGLYLSLVNRGNYNAAIDELKRFLENHPANLYKDTLSELMQDIDRGYAMKFKEVVYSLAKKNDLA